MARRPGCILEVWVLSHLDHHVGGKTFGLALTHGYPFCVLVLLNVQRLVYRSNQPPNGHPPSAVFSLFIPSPVLLTF